MSKILMQTNSNGCVRTLVCFNPKTRHKTHERPTEKSSATRARVEKPNIIIWPGMCKGRRSTPLQFTKGRGRASALGTCSKRNAYLCIVGIARVCTSISVWLLSRVWESPFEGRQTSFWGGGKTFDFGYWRGCFLVSQSERTYPLAG